MAGERIYQVRSYETKSMGRQGQDDDLEKSKIYVMLVFKHVVTYIPSTSLDFVLFKILHIYGA